MTRIRVITRSMTHLHLIAQPLGSPGECYQGLKVSPIPFPCVIYCANSGSASTYLQPARVFRFKPESSQSAIRHFEYPSVDNGVHERSVFQYLFLIMAGIRCSNGNRTRIDLFTAGSSVSIQTGVKPAIRHFEYPSVDNGVHERSVFQYLCLIMAGICCLNGNRLPSTN